MAKLCLKPYGRLTHYKTHIAKKHGKPDLGVRRSAIRQAPDSFTQLYASIACYKSWL